MATDPVCGMEVKEAEAAAESRFEGRTYFFCSPACRARFEGDPARFARPPGEGTPPS